MNRIDSPRFGSTPVAQLKRYVPYYTQDNGSDYVVILETLPKPEEDKNPYKGSGLFKVRGRRYHPNGDRNFSHDRYTYSPRVTVEVGVHNGISNLTPVLEGWHIRRAENRARWLREAKGDVTLDFCVERTWNTIKRLPALLARALDSGNYHSKLVRPNRFEEYALPRDHVRVSHEILEAVLRDFAQQKDVASMPPDERWKKVQAYPFNQKQLRKLLPFRTHEYDCIFPREMEELKHAEAVQYDEARKEYTITEKGLKTMGFDPATLKTDFHQVNLVPFGDPVITALRYFQEAIRAQEKTPSKLRQAVEAQMTAGHYQLKNLEGPWLAFEGALQHGLLRNTAPEIQQLRQKLERSFPLEAERDKVDIHNLLCTLTSTYDELVDLVRLEKSPIHPTYKPGQSLGNTDYVGYRITEKGQKLLAEAGNENTGN